MQSLDIITLIKESLFLNNFLKQFESSLLHLLYILKNIYKILTHDRFLYGRYTRIFFKNDHDSFHDVHDVLIIELG